MSTTPSTETRRSLRWLLLLLGVGWLLGTLGLLWRALAASLTFFGERPTAAEVARTTHLLTGAAVVAVGVPLLGLVLSAVVRSRAGRWSFVAMLVLGAVLALAVAYHAHEVHIRTTTPRPRAPTCQEYSGGGTRCPGG